MAPKTFLAIILISFPVNAADFQEKKDGSMVITLTKQEMLDCAKEGGCALISMKGLQEVAKNAAAYMCGKSI